MSLEDMGSLFRDEVKCRYLEVLIPRLAEWSDEAR